MLPVMRNKKTKNYTVMPNYHLQDRNISLKAKGLLSYMLSLPDCWEYSISGLAAICKEGPDCIRATIKELEERGYITRERKRLENGQLGGAEYFIWERPVHNDNQEKPMLENPTQDISMQEHPRQINTNLKKDVSNKYVNTPHTPQGGCERQNDTPSQSAPKKQPAVEPKYRPDWFDRFWKLYPRHTAKQSAVRAWDKLKPDLDLCKVMAKAIREQMKTEQWSNPNHIPHPSTWLNGARWLDEIKEPDRGGGESGGLPFLT